MIKNLTMIIILLFCFYTFSGAEVPRKRVLYISSYSPAFPIFSQQVDGIKSVLNGENILTDIEFMDTKRLPGPENVRIFHNMLNFKLKKLPSYDAVIVADDAALIYAAGHKNDLFKNIPVFFCGINDLEMAAGFAKSPQIRGVVEAVSMRETLELIKMLFYERVRLAVIVDGTVSGQADLKSFISASRGLPFNVEILSLQQMTFEQLNERLTGLGSDTSILLISAYTDKTGLTRLFDDELSDIRRNSRVPIFHLWEHGIGEGVFGGKVIDHHDQGREAARMVLKYLKGASVGSIENLNESPNRYIFDYNELKRFSIESFRLPADSIIKNVPETFFELHKKEIIVSGFIIISLMYVAVVLIFEKRRLKNIVDKQIKELAEGEERWKFSLESAGQDVWDWNLRTNRIYISRRWNEEFRITDEETDQDMVEYAKEIHEDDLEYTDKIMINHLKGLTPIYESVHRVMGRSGTYRWVLSRGKVIERSQEGRALRIIGTATDITELKKIEEEINKSRRMLQIVIDSIPVGVFWKDRNFKYIGCSNVYAKLVGFESAEKIIDKKDDEIFSRELAEAHTRIDEEILRTGNGKLNYEDQAKLPDGRVKTFKKSKVPLTDDKGEIIGILGTYEDISEQKSLREENFRIRNLESVGILAAGIAHDFNNLLMAIYGAISVIKIDQNINSKNLEWIEHAEKTCIAATELTTRLITFSQGGAPLLQNENIADIMNEAIEFVLKDSSIVINYSARVQQKSVMIDGRQIRQVFINIIENAREAMPDGGVIEINSSDEVLYDDNIYELSAGEYIKVSLKDSGPGIPESIIDKIFDPYFSTKGIASHKGQGLGLAICHSIMKQHHGKITVSSIPGNGALFTVYIPRWKE